MSRSKVPVVLALAIALLGAVLGLVAGAGVAGAGVASAATDPITIVSAGSPASNVGDLTVVADSTVSITAMTADLVPFNTNVQPTLLSPVLTQTGTASTADGQIQSTWSVATPITESQLSLGDYQINLDVTFSDSTTTSLTNVGVLAFGDQLTFTVAANHTQVSYDNQVVIVSGSVTALNPDGTTTPFADQAVTMVGTVEGDQSVPTDANGDFTVTLRPQGGDWVLFEANINSGSRGESQAINFTAQLDPVKMTASLSATTVTYGNRVTASGTVTYDPAGSYVPLPDHIVTIYETQDPYASVASAMTNASGRFSVVLPNVAGDTTWTLNGGGVVGDPYLDQASLSLPMKVNLPIAITGFHASLSQYWQLSYGGCVGFARSIPGSYVQASLVIQYAPRPSGPWRTLNVETQLSGGCGNQGARFSGTATAPVNYAYYRAYERAVPSDGGTDPGRTAAASAAVLAWKYADRITGLSVSPRSLAAGGNLTVKGQLQYYRSGWHDYGSQLVYIVYRAKGSSTWYWIVKVKANSAGRFSATFRDWTSATWSAVYEGNSTHLSAGGSSFYVSVSG
jgi:hypothetical protein